MYPSLPDSSRSTVSAIVTLPDGRKIRIRESGYTEGDTNAWVETSEPEMFWEDGDDAGELLTEEEMDSPAYLGEDKSMTVAEFVHEFATDWRHED